MFISETVLNLLDFEKSLFHFAENLRGELGEKAVASLTPCKNLEQLEERQALLKSWLDCSDRYGDKFIQWDDEAACVTEIFPHAKKSGMISGAELLKIRTLLSLAARAKNVLSEMKSDANKYFAFDVLERRLRDFAPEIEILAVVEDSGRLADNASPKLAELRSELEGLKRAGRKTASRLIEDPGIANMLQERSLAYRDGRFMLLVRQEYVNRFPGLLVDRSASGNSVYM